MLLVACIPALFYMLGAFMIPESPRYLVQAGKLAEARAIIARMPDTIDVEEQVKRIQDSLASAARVPGFAALKGAVLGLKPIVWVGIALAMLQQFVGINVIFYYSNSLWMAVGFATALGAAFPALAGAGAASPSTGCWWRGGPTAPEHTAQEAPATPAAC